MNEIAHLPTLQVQVVAKNAPRNDISNKKGGEIVPLISRPQEVEAIYQEARERGVCLADFCVAHPYAVEATLRAALEFSQEHNLANIPVIISVTGNYPIEF